MKRWDLITKIISGGVDRYMQESDKGTYVKYDDIRHLLEKDGCKVGELVDVRDSEKAAWELARTLLAIAGDAFMVTPSCGRGAVPYLCARPHVPRKITRPATKDDIGQTVWSGTGRPGILRLVVERWYDDDHRKFVIEEDGVMRLSAIATVEEDAT